jgi:hypothetical protein
MDLFLHMVYITSLIPPPFIEMPVPSQESDPSCICVSGVGFTSFYDFFYWVSELLRHCGIFCIFHFIIWQIITMTHLFGVSLW